MDARSTLRRAAKRIESTRNHIATLPCDLPAWQAIATAGQLAAILQLNDYLRAAAALAREIAARLDQYALLESGNATVAEPTADERTEVQP